jgi:hypothetical protein
VDQVFNKDLYFLIFHLVTVCASSRSGTSTISTGTLQYVPLVVLESGYSTWWGEQHPKTCRDMDDDRLSRHKGRDVAVSPRYRCHFFKYPARTNY